MANKTIVNSKITALNAIQVITQTAADETTDITAQKFIYTPTGKDGHLVFIMYNAVAFAITTTITAGVRVFGAPAKVDSIPATAGTYTLQIETGKYMLANGTVEISFLPATAGKDLVNDHALTVGVIELQ